MSFAIIQTGGKQYRVKASEILKIEQLENLKPESKIEFNEVLAYGDDKNIEVGSPLVKGAKVDIEYDSCDSVMYPCGYWKNDKISIHDLYYQLTDSDICEIVQYLYNFIFVNPKNPI